MLVLCKQILAVLSLDAEPIVAQPWACLSSLFTIST